MKIGQDNQPREKIRKIENRLKLSRMKAEAAICCVIPRPPALLQSIDNDQDLSRAKENLEGLAAVYTACVDEMVQLV